MTDDNSRRRNRHTSMDDVAHLFRQLIADTTPSVPPPIKIAKPKPLRRTRKKRRNGIEGFQRESRRTYSPTPNPAANGEDHVGLLETNGMDHENHTNHEHHTNHDHHTTQRDSNDHRKRLGHSKLSPINQSSSATIIYKPSPRRVSVQSGHSANSAQSQSSIFSESNKIRCSQIGQILMDHNFVSNRDVLNRAMDELQRETDEDELNKEYLAMELIDALHDDLYSETECCLYLTFKDDLGLSDEQRLRAYDVVLHYYYDLDDLDKVWILYIPSLHSLCTCHHLKYSVE